MTSPIDLAAAPTRPTSRAFARASLRALMLVAPFALSLSTASCGASDGVSEPLGQNEAATFANDHAAYNYFVGKGLTPFQAAGIVGNLDQESGDSPTAVQSPGPGRGLAQWSVGGRWDTDSNDNATWYANKTGQGVWTFQLQLDFIWYELTTFSGYGLAQLKATTNVTDATVVFQDKFEGCGTCDQTKRVSYAQAVLSAYGSAPAYAAQFVSQSFPYATTTMQMTEGQVIPSYIELKNVGTKTWDSNTRIATTQPRDRASVFADKSWVSTSRLAAVVGTVPPGSTYKFQFDLAAPNKTGTFDEFFGVVEDGTAWFSDPGQGGPPDNDLEVKIQVVAGPASSDAGAPPSGDAGSPKGDSGSSSSEDAGASSTEDAGTSQSGDDGGVAEAGSPVVNLPPVASNGGCSVGVASGEGTRSMSAFAGMFVAIGAVIRGRRRRRR
jgi:hypothetical protein